MAEKVVRASDRPVLLVKSPPAEARSPGGALLKRVLVPLDGSEEGESALPYAAALGRSLGSELVALHVVEPVPWLALSMPLASPMPQDIDRLMASADEYLKEVQKKLQAEGLATSAVAVWGYAADKIVDYAESHHIDLIAMSTRGRSGVSRWVLGSVADKVLHTGETPVLVVPPARR